MEGSLLDDCVGLVSVLLLVVKCCVIFWGMSSWRDSYLSLRTISYELTALCVGSLLGAVYVLPSTDRYTLFILSLPTFVVFPSKQAQDPVNHAFCHFSLRAFLGDIFSSVPFYLASFPEEEHIARLFTALVVANYGSILLLLILFKFVISKRARRRPMTKTLEQVVMTKSFNHSVDPWLLLSSRLSFFPKDIST